MELALENPERIENVNISPPCYCPEPIPQQSLGSGDFTGKCSLCLGTLREGIKIKKGRKKKEPEKEENVHE